jgi:hypothetical protein
MGDDRYKAALERILRVLNDTHLELPDVYDAVEAITREALQVDAFSVPTSGKGD